MDTRNIGFFLGLGALVVQSPAAAADFTCHVAGGTLMLDETDFKALKEGKVIKEIFASLDSNSNRRTAIRETRMLWRLIKAGKAENCDFIERYKNYNVLYFDDSELDAVMDAQHKATASALTGTAKKCQ